MASRRKRGPVAFRPRLLAGLALSLQLLSIVEDRLRCRIFNSIGTYSSGGNVRFGSLAAPQDSTILRSAFGGKAASQSAVFLIFKGPLTARSGHSLTKENPTQWRGWLKRVGYPSRARAGC